ncbi:MAG TPA: 4'-phosphopantetheinyl transferase superfamily protein [Luteimonas sp.]|jgi:4'-phosphopantetheinyl transferase|nr:4'-phosphopantetheinyl transferase superfamily protein [Luteimonas sp.]
MPPSTPFSTPGGIPRWHWQPWQGGERAPAGGAWAAAHDWLATLPGVPEGALPLHRDLHGRPRFAAGIDADAGWSHSGDGLLLAFARGAMLGVDMEYERPRPKALEIARRHFAPPEAAWLESHAPTAGSGAEGALSPRDLAFLRLWCAKEAVLKAHGRGLAFGLHRLAFAEIDGALVLAEADPALGDAAAWSLHEFVPHPGYRAALAWRSSGPSGPDGEGVSPEGTP